MLPHPVALWRHILCRILGAALGLLALACAIYMLAGCSAASFDVAEAKQGETAGEDDGVGADSGAPADTGTAEASTDAGGSEDGGCPFTYTHYDPLTETHYTNCIPTGVPGDPTTYPAALLDGEIAHVQTVLGETWVEKRQVTCGPTCEARAVSKGGVVTWGTWCSAEAMAGAYAESTGSPMCPPTDFTKQWW